MKKPAFIALNIVGMMAVIFLFVRGWYYRPKLALKQLVISSELTEPSAISILPGEKDIFFVSEKKGRVVWFEKDAPEYNGVVLDLTPKVYSRTTEVGFLGLAFDPGFKTNGFLYVFYSMENPKRSRLARFTLDKKFRADPASELVLLEVLKTSDNHNGGCLEFGKDGMLYVSIGDSFLGEKKPKVLNRRNTVYGTLLRLDVSRSSARDPYRIPKDNPFVGVKSRIPNEVYALGFRNPWRFSFDLETQKIYLADVGKNRREEVNIIEAGANYGWPTFEGELCMKPKRCVDQNFAKPIATFAHDFYLRSIIGGYVYRGSTLAWLKGRYIFADYLRGVFYIDLPSPPAMVHQANVLLYKMPTPSGKYKGSTILVSTMAQDSQGELYIANLEGAIYQLVEPDFLTSARGFLFSMLSFR